MMKGGTSFHKHSRPSGCHDYKNHNPLTVIYVLIAGVNMINSRVKDSKTICEFVKLLFRNWKNKEQLRDLILSFSFMPKKEKELLILIYCDCLPLKNVAYKMNVSHRWAAYMHSRCITTAAPHIFSFILNVLTASY